MVSIVPVRPSVRGCRQVAFGFGLENNVCHVVISLPSVSLLSAHLIGCPLVVNQLPLEAPLFREREEMMVDPDGICTGGSVGTVRISS